ncbi:M23 family metallopeptidase [uncultured Citricoccus sp.]|uniref:M23 family metallopeptidase n=1 Tax=uncultured Citricoccus sp. TaxID=614031 RepID=UPI0026196E4C|nr:peptidoglycan DD-metalloendopeptidase family protein [uncultured Citricoccus sp.]
MSRRFAPALATTTALVVLAATGGMVPSAAVPGAHAERAMTYLAPSSPQRSAYAGAGVVTAPDAVVEAASRAGLAEGTAERTRVRQVQSSSGQAALDRYAGEVPPYVNAAPLALVGRAFDHPVAGPFTLSSAFGWRKNPTHVGPTAQFHIGLDYAVACGTPVLAAADGTVVSAGERGTGGLRVDIDHGDGLVTSYRHNSRLLVSPGDRVGRGDAISLSGTTGNSTGCHLHFDTTLEGLYVDPVHLLPEVAGQPRALDAVDRERIRAAAREDAPAVAPERREAAPRTGQPAAPGPIAREAAPRTGTRGDHARAPEAPAAKDRSPRPPSAGPSGTPASPGASPTTPTATRPAERGPKPSGTTKPVHPRPTPPAVTPKPKPAAPGTPAATEPAEPAQPTHPGPSAPATPTPTKPSTPDPAQPTPTTPTTPGPAQPTPTKPAQPTPSPSPTEPVTPTPSPTEPTAPEPSVPASPPAPVSLTEEEAARWCLPLDDDTEQARPDFTTIFTGDFADLVGLVAVLDDEGGPEPVTEETLVEVSPSALWLESLPACSDAEFLETALG